eukprot:m.65217 g.65217  ORF g.65217 m.65217 type:complete len:226 (+) comp7312_c0_seq1:1171-1848(+)
MADSVLGGSDDITGAWGSQSGGTTYLAFTRPLAAHGSTDLAITDSTMYLLLAAAPTDGYGTTYGKHVPESLSVFAVNYIQGVNYGKIQADALTAPAVMAYSFVALLGLACASILFCNCLWCIHRRRHRQPKRRVSDVSRTIEDIEDISATTDMAAEQDFEEYIRRRSTHGQKELSFKPKPKTPPKVISPSHAAARHRATGRERSGLHPPLLVRASEGPRESHERI